MKTRPKPTEMVVLTGAYNWGTHYGYIENEKLRFLCGNKISRYKRNKVVNKKVTCDRCNARFKAIERMIAKLGVEWVCEGRWLPMEERTFKDGT